MSTAITEHLHRDIASLRTRGVNVHSVRDRVHHIDFDTEESHRHDFYQIKWFQRGVGRYQIDFIERPLQDHTLHFVLPGQVHRYQFDPACEGLVIVLTEQFFLTSEENRQWLRSLPLLLSQLYFQPLSIAGEGAAIFIALTAQLLLEQTRKAPYTDEIVRSLINLFLFYAGREITFHHRVTFAEGYGNRQAQLVQKFFDLVEQHFQRLHGVTDYAALLAITPNYLNEVVKTQTARTAGAIIADRVVLEAKRLAYFSDRAVQEIATRLGFQDPAYFSRFFKQQSGQTLSQFRATIRKKSNSDHS